MRSESKRCAAKRKDGQPCLAPALESGFCFAHDPARKADRDAARRRGGANSAKIVRLRGLVPPRLQPVYDMLERALREVHDGDISSRQATAMASVSRAMVAVLTAGELEERVRALEAELAKDGARKWVN